MQRAGAGDNAGARFFISTGRRRRAAKGEEAIPKAIIGGLTAVYGCDCRNILDLSTVYTMKPNDRMYFER